MTIKEILNSYDFPHKFYVKYAVACAKYAISFDKSPYSSSLRAIDLAERFSQGEDISKEDLYAAASATSATSAAYSAYSATSAAYAAADAAYAAYTAHAAHATTADESYCKALLLNMIEQELSELECILLDIDMRKL